MPTTSCPALCLSHGFHSPRNSDKYIPHKWIVLFARADWLARRWLAKNYSPPSSRRKTKWHIVTNKVTLWAANYSACVVYTKTIIHLSVGPTGGYLPPLRWIIVNYLLTDLFADLAPIAGANYTYERMHAVAYSPYIFEVCRISAKLHVIRLASLRQQVT